MNDGVYLELDGRPAVRFERLYPHPVDRVWMAITDPEELVAWFPSRAVIEPRVGGSVSFSGDPYSDTLTGEVLAYDPPTRLAFTWGENELHFELEEVGVSACRFVLTDFLDVTTAAARNASGWTVCVGELDKLLAGTRGNGPHAEDTPPFWPIYDHYVAAGMPHGADIPLDRPSV